jgi:hypothetical protein
VGEDALIEAFEEFGYILVDLDAAGRGFYHVPAFWSADGGLDALRAFPRMPTSLERVRFSGRICNDEVISLNRSR